MNVPKVGDLVFGSYPSRLGIITKIVTDINPYYYYIDWLSNKPISGQYYCFEQTAKEFRDNFLAYKIRNKL
jgi:hypothetical protein